MNWVGGARNRIKLKHEKRLQKEFFERKRQLRSSFKTSPSRSIHNKQKTNSQDLFSLEVIMTAHKSGSTKSNVGNKENTFQPMLHKMSPIRRLPQEFVEEKFNTISCEYSIGQDCICQSQSHRSHTNDKDAVQLPWSNEGLDPTKFSPGMELPKTS